MGVGRGSGCVRRRGVVRALEWTDGAVLLERLSPGHSLVDLVAGGRDDEATDILVER